MRSIITSVALSSLLILAAICATGSHRVVVAAPPSLRFVPKTMWTKPLNGDNGRIASVGPRPRGKSAEYDEDTVVYIPDGARLLALNQLDGSERWTYEGFSGDITTRPVVSTFTVFFGTTGGMWHAVNRQNGKKRWTFRASYKVINDDGVISPRDEKIFCGGSYDNDFYCLDADSGETLWKFHFYKSAGFIAGAAVMDDDQTTVFVPTATERATSGITAIDLKTGRRRWSTNVGSIESRIFYSDGFIIAGVEEFGVTALRAGSGQRAWKYTRDYVTISGAVPIAVADGVVYVCHETFQVALDLNNRGKLLWEITGSDFPVVPPVVFDYDKKDGGRTNFVLLAQKNKMVLVDKATGQPKFDFLTKGDVTAVAPSTSRRGWIFFGSWNEGDLFYALDISAKMETAGEGDL